jgi:phosphoribosylamine--glycine ligase
MEEIIQPMHHHLRNQEIPYRGCLYVGLMIDGDGAPRVVEFNVRFGDPETQVTIPLIESDLAELLHASSRGELASIEPRFSNKNAITIVLASEGYPASPITDLPIAGSDIKLEEGESCAFVHHAGTRLTADGTLLSTGGRVLSVTGIAPGLREAAELAYQLIDVIDLEGSHFRRDIGHRGL